MVVVLMPIALLAGVLGGVLHDQGATWLIFVGALVLVSSSSAAIRVFSVALYRYATTGDPQPPFPSRSTRAVHPQARGLFGRRK